MFLYFLGARTPFHEPGYRLIPEEVITSSYPRLVTEFVRLLVETLHLQDASP